ncbi:MAG TPA: DUF5946 family protein [Ktedonobacterales bacterium]
MNSTALRACPGCGLSLPISDSPAADERVNASPECWDLHGELTAYTVTRGDSDFIHQLLVDTYAAQHVNALSRPIGIAFALIGLYLTYEKGYNGRQVQHTHMLLARRSKQWPTFQRPLSTGALTVFDVLQCEPGEALDSMLREWGDSVWEAWSAEHARVRELFETVMAD